MLGWLGKWASSKGMGKIPSIGGLTRPNARTAITNAGFNLGTETSLGNAEGATAQNDGTVKERSDVNQLLNYEETLNFEYYTYVVVPPYFVPPYFVPPFFPFFPPTFNPPFFPPTFNPPFFPPVFTSLTTYYWCCCAELDVKVGSFATFDDALNFATDLCAGSGEGVCINPSVTPVTCTPTPFFPPTFNPPFFPPVFTSMTTWYFCCADGSGGTVQAANSGDAVTLASNWCINESLSTGPMGGVYTTPQSCNTPPFFPPTFNPPFFPPSFSATIWYCSTTEIGGDGQYRGTWTSDVSGELCDSYKTVCSQSGYPPYPTVPSCAPNPFFPPYFVPPFFPPYFVPPYFVPPFFPPAFNAPNPFFPPYFVPPYFVPPFFPPSFTGCDCYAPSYNCPACCNGNCFY